MPPGQDDNPFGTPRGAWGLQPPTTFGLSKPVTRPSRPGGQIRVPAPAAPPHNILTGGLIPRARREPPASSPPQAPPPQPPPETAPAPADPTLVRDSVLARAGGAKTGRGPSFPPVAGIGLVVAAIVVVGVLLMARTWQGEPAIAPLTPAPATAAAIPAQPAPIPEPAAEPAPTPAPVRAASTPRPQPQAPAAGAESPPPLTAPPVPNAPAIPPPTDPDAPMTTRLPGPD